MWGNGCLYEGEFERNDMHGEGSYAWSDGRMYSGQWTRNFMGPAGSMQWPDGRVYDGEFQDGRKHGEGTHWWPDGRSYKGQWRDGRQHGTGVARTAKGMECKGQWQDGKFVKWLDMISPGDNSQPSSTKQADGGADTAAGSPNPTQANGAEGPEAGDASCHPDENVDAKGSEEKSKCSPDAGGSGAEYSDTAASADT